MAAKKTAKALPPLRLDLGCGTRKKEGFTGVDSIKFDGVDVVADLRKRWPWKDGTVDEIHCSHFIEHLTARERVHFCNEAYRVMKPGAQMTLIAPHGGSGRAYGDMTHQWPPVWEFWFYYLSKEWRTTNAPHDDARWSPGGYDCNFEVSWWHALRPDLLSRNQEYQTYALANYKEAAQDIVATFKKA
jgi:hypothetical protein